MPVLACAGAWNSPVVGCLDTPRRFRIGHPPFGRDSQIRHTSDTARARQARLTKPAGSLGRLEELACWLAGWQVFMNMFILGWVGIAMGKVCALVFGWPVWVGLVVPSVITAVYTLAAGYWGVVMGDFLQGIVAIFAIVVVSAAGIAAVGGPDAITARVIELGDAWRLDPLAFTGWFTGDFPAVWWLTMLVIAVIGGFGPERLDASDFDLAWHQGIYTDELVAIPLQSDTGTLDTFASNATILRTAKLCFIGTALQVPSMFRTSSRSYSRSRLRTGWHKSRRSISFSSTYTTTPK